MPLKRLTVCALSLVAALSVAITANAAVHNGDTDNRSEITSLGDSSRHTFYGRYSAAEPEGVYHIDISWGSMEFTYHAENSVWDSVNHQWDDNGSGVWVARSDGISDKITVDNHSSEAVNLTFSAQKVADPEIWDKTQIGDFVPAAGETKTLTDRQVILLKTTEGKPELDENSTVSVLYRPKGYVTSALAEQKVIGALTVTVTEA